MCVLYLEYYFFLFKVLSFPCIFVKAFVALDKKITPVNVGGMVGCLLTYPGRIIFFQMICFYNILEPMISPC